MSAIVRYIAPNTECVNGLPRQEHHFWLDLSEHDDHVEVADWVLYNTKPDQRQFWPETVPTSHNSYAIQFHVILKDDRIAMLFRLRW